MTVTGRCVPRREVRPRRGHLPVHGCARNRVRRPAETGTWPDALGTARSSVSSAGLHRPRDGLRCDSPPTVADGGGASGADSDEIGVLGVVIDPARHARAAWNAARAVLRRHEQGRCRDPVLELESDPCAAEGRRAARAWSRGDRRTVSPRSMAGCRGRSGRRGRRTRGGGRCSGR